ncbi:MAG: HAMP domain-containing protein, partial [Alphaproteobacteria bacterium]
MLKNLKISTKIIGTVVGVSLTGLALSGFAATQMSLIDANYSDMVTSRDTAIVKLARAGRNVSEASYSAYKTIAYEGASAEAKTASVARDDAIAKATPFLEDGKAAFPFASAQFLALEEILKKVDETSKRAVDLGLSNNDDAARAFLISMDTASADFAKGYQSLRDELLASTAAESDGLSATTWSTITMLLGGTFAAMLLGIGGALLVSSKGITGPLNRLSQHMSELASGRIDIEIEGQDRRDEVGGMAKAV